MKKKYLIRLDDACPTMNRKKWRYIEEILDKYSIKPMVGVIPHNEDPQQIFDAEDASFWDKVKAWEKKGWAIALHGYNHCYDSNGGMQGLNPMWERSEFAGLPLEDQRKKINQGVSVLRQHGINPKYFFAPSHTFDDFTLLALKEESDIRIVSDTIAYKPYRYGEFIFIPQLGGHCCEIKLPGLWTFCLHPNVMSDNNFLQTEVFIKKHVESFVSFGSLNLSGLKEKSFLSILLSWAYFAQRHFRCIK